MKVTYIDHSSFLVETDTYYLLFDYVQGELPKMEMGKNLVVFASHHHGDHFSPLIFDLADQYPDVWYVISNDISKSRIPERFYGRLVYLGPNEEMAAAELVVRTYKSTDEGVAFVVEAEGSTIYHGGDLNHWKWIGEPDSWNQSMGEAYHKELEKMAWEKIDVAFLPVDSRLKEYFCLGADEFMKGVGAKVVFPMHCWEDYTVGARWKELPSAEDYKEGIIEIHEKGAHFFIETRER